MSAPGSEREQLLRELRARLSRIHHDLNNPLSIISGNAQLMAELARALGVDEDLGGPLEDIQAAVDGMTDTADRLLDLRRLIMDALDGTEPDVTP